MKLYAARDWLREVPSSGPVDPWRSPSKRDYGRIIHCASFRRLQGKTQIFPGHESDFFRNRLTHSLEVAQIAEGIVQRLNHVSSELQNNPIDERLCAAASLVHDIGHPPFGHNGERALDDAMRRYGGFEGNAQTLRILTRLEKKVYRATPLDGDIRAGLNLSYRLLGATLKYNKPIPVERDASSKLAKGYYHTEASTVEKFKTAILRGKALPRGKVFKTIECWIMDVADDIAYSTYDLEDSLKAGFLTPLGILSSKAELLDQTAQKVRKELGLSFNSQDVLDTFADIFSGLTTAADDDEDDLIKLARGYRGSQTIAESSYVRTKLSSQLVHQAIGSVELDYDSKFPMLSRVRLSDEARRRVEVLKQYTFVAMVYSARVKVPEFRGYSVVKGIFDALESERGHLLLPDDVRDQLTPSNPGERMRIICDFVAGMTDRYAVEFYARLHSDGGQSMWKPL